MKYFESDFLHEILILRRTPQTKEETYNKLLCLRGLETQRNGVDFFRVNKLSKRRNRLLKMYWAFN